MPTGTQMVVARCLHAPSSLVVMLPLFPHGTKEDLTRQTGYRTRQRQGQSTVPTHWPQAGPGLRLGPLAAAALMLE